MRWLVWCSIALSLIGYCLILVHSASSFVCGLAANVCGVVYNARVKRDMAQMALFAVYSLLAIIGFILWTR